MNMATYIFYCIIIVFILSSLIKKKIKNFLSGRKKDVDQYLCKKNLLWKANYDRENNDYTNTFIHIMLNSVIFRQISYEIVLCAWHFLPVSFFPKYMYYFNKLASSYSQI